MARHGLKGTEKNCGHAVCSLPCRVRADGVTLFVSGGKMRKLNFADYVEIASLVGAIVIVIVIYIVVAA
jgi:hypothetical protein